jgi:hypothetical protein
MDYIYDFLQVFGILMCNFQFIPKFKPPDMSEGKKQKISMKKEVES